VSWGNVRDRAADTKTAQLLLREQFGLTERTAGQQLGDADTLELAVELV
jgi:hypothetical protein